MQYACSVFIYINILELYNCTSLEELKVRQWNGCGTVLPIRGGGLAGPNWGLLQISFPYVPYNVANLK